MADVEGLDITRGIERMKKEGERKKEIDGYLDRWYRVTGVTKDRNIHRNILADT